MTMLIIGINVEVLARTELFFLPTLAVLHSLFWLCATSVSYLYLLVVVSSQISCDEE